ncbi:MAG: phosphopantetheine-binding protein [Phycisphaerae bacterium]|nr:phosphopantetheine-binding protein [Phycisphaerae bacterium]
MADDLRGVVIAMIRQVLSDHGRIVAAVLDEQGLFADGVGLDSLDLATLVVRLEQATGRDPFRSGECDRLPRTVGELVSIYRGKATA